MNLQEDEVFVLGEYVDTLKGFVLYHYGGFIVECYYNAKDNRIEKMTGISIESAAMKYVCLEQLLL